MYIYTFCCVLYNVFFKKARGTTRGHHTTCDYRKTIFTTTLAQVDTCHVTVTVFVSQEIFARNVRLVESSSLSSLIIVSHRPCECWTSLGGFKANILFQSQRL